MLSDREVGDIKEFVHWASRTSAEFLSEEAETKAANLLMRISKVVTPVCQEALTAAWRDHRHGGDKANLARIGDLVIARMQTKKYNDKPIV